MLFERLDVFNQDTFQAFAYVLCCIGSLLHLVHNLFDFHKFDTVFLFFEKSDDEEFVDIITFILQIVELFSTFADVYERLPDHR